MSSTAATATATASSSTSSLISGYLPTNPFDLPETRELIDQHVASGEITRGDVEIMKKGYRWMMYTPPAGAIAFSALTWALMKKQFPRPRIYTRLFWGTVAFGTGGLVGFGAAGLAAAMEVNDKIHDGDRKAEIFNEITERSREIQLANAPPPSTSSKLASKTGQVPANPSPALSAKPVRSPSNLPRDFEFPPQRERSALISEDEIKRGKGTWEKVKSWIPGL